MGIAFWAALVLASTHVWAAELYQYQLPQYPVGSEPCEPTARRLGEKFAKDGAVEIQEADCKPDGKGTASITLRYIAESPLPLVTTDARFSGAQGSIGAYASYETCAADVGDQESRFRSATGLLPFISYCYRSSSIVRHPYAIRIDSFGRPKVRPFRFVREFTGVPAVDPEALAASTAEAFAKTGVRIAHTIVASNSGAGDSSYRVGILYYAEREAYWTFFWNYFSFESVDACRSELERLNEAMGLVKATPKAAFCSWDKLLFGAHFNVLVETVSPWITWETPGKEYPKLAACQADRAAVIELYQKKLGKPALTAICDRKRNWPNPYRLKVLLPRKSAGDFLCTPLPEFPAR